MPLEVDAILELGLDKTAFIAVNYETMAVIPVPQQGDKTRIVRFFLSRHDCEGFISKLKEDNVDGLKADLRPFEVPLIVSLHLAEGADTFTVHSPNEVFDFLKSHAE